MSNTKTPLNFDTGKLTQEQIEGVFESLPVDITFVDKDNQVQYFNNYTTRIFKRPKTVIGRKVQNCHPKHSLHAVNKILKEFTAGERDVAEFWIELDGRMIHIRYFPVYNQQEEYLGCLEVSQDITAIQELSGEKRLLD
ncbi:MAG: PAS domain-containing protein [Asgard group archaeon]|nr:PAS domain-containing protein [Asgard group archaeon]